MEVATLKTDLYDKIEHADDQQIKEIYGIITNYFSEQIVIGGEWGRLY